MENIKEIKLQRHRIEVSSDIGGEFTIPDYLPDIKRILVFEDSVLPPAKYVDADGYELTCRVCVGILYLGADNRLWSAEFPTDCTQNIKIPGKMPDSADGDMAFVRTEGLGVRLLSPRKLLVKGKLLSEVYIFSDAEKNECMTERFLPSGCEALYGRVKYMSVCESGGDSFEVADEYVSEMGRESERIIRTAAHAHISDAEASEDYVTVKGEVTVDVISEDDDSGECPKLQRRRIPFEKKLECVGATPESKAYAIVTPGSAEAVTDGVKVSLKVYCSLEVFAFCEECEKVCIDVYSPAASADVGKNVIKCNELLHMSRGSMSLNGSVQGADAGFSGGERIVVASCEVSEAHLLSDEGKRRQIVGACKFKIVTCDDSTEPMQYDVKEVKLPFKYELGDRADFVLDECTHYCVEVIPERAGARYDGERAGVDAELMISLLVMKEWEISVVADVTLTENNTEKDGNIMILYPASGDSLWDIAKRERVPLLEFCEKNRVEMPEDPSSPDSLSKCRFLMF